MSAMNDIRNIIMLEKSDSRYPPLLREIARPPEILYCLGDVSLLTERCAAVVGARKVTSYGRWVAYNTAASLSRHGVVTVSGMAYGADSYAHKGALENDGKTIAVLGCGVDVCYPASNRRLYSDIIRNGLVISEFKPGTHPFRGGFPLRNRIISGLSEVTVITEAGLGSGSLITAEAALEQGRTIFAAPANINVISSIGCNKLILDGAIPLISTDDVAREMGIALVDRKTENESLGQDEQEIYKILKENGDMFINRLCELTAKTPAEVNPIVTVLEIKGMVGTFMGKIFIAK